MGRGRLSKEAKLIPPTEEHQKDADLFMEIIGRNYNRLFDGCKINAQKNKILFSPDVFQQTIILCYEAVQRQGIRDKTDQGVCNYFFRAYNTNVLREVTNPYNARKTDGEEFFKTYDVIDENDAETKAMDEVFKDFCVHRILEEVERVFDPQSFYLYRIKFLVPKTSYRRLVAMTGIKNAKSKVQAVVEWCKQNISEEQLKKEFEINFGK